MLADEKAKRLVACPDCNGVRCIGGRMHLTACPTCSGTGLRLVETGAER